LLTVVALITGMVGCSTHTTPIEVSDWYDLDAVRDSLASNYILMNDLDSTTPGYTELASPTANQGKGWDPIGTSLDNALTGTFDGQGHEIRDLFIDRPDESEVGLFGVVDEVGVVENVGMVNGNVTGYDNTGGLVGKNEGTVSNSPSNSDVTGNANVGGLVGYNYKGTVSNSYSTGNVTGSVYVGGLVGVNPDNVNNSYSTGSVTGYHSVGGLVGVSEGTVSNSYSTGNVTGTEWVGGLVAENDGTVSNSFWDIETSGQATSDGGTGKTTARMQDISTFTAVDWEIIAVPPGHTNDDYTWNIVNGVTYPFLSWQA